MPAESTIHHRRNPRPVLPFFLVAIPAILMIAGMTGAPGARADEVAGRVERQTTRGHPHWNAVQ
ncbi:MAG: hypothetical protein AAFN70_12350, partial [Planctomycetota bacterium]